MIPTFLNLVCPQLHPLITKSTSLHPFAPSKSKSTAFFPFFLIRCTSCTTARNQVAYINAVRYVHRTCQRLPHTTTTRNPYTKLQLRKPFRRPARHNFRVVNFRNNLKKNISSQVLGSINSFCRKNSSADYFSREIKLEFYYLPPYPPTRNTPHQKFANLHSTTFAQGLLRLFYQRPALFSQEACEGDAYTHSILTFSSRMCMVLQLVFSCDTLEEDFDIKMEQHAIQCCHLSRIFLRSPEISHSFKTVSR